jgi:hypothetical protein
MNERDNELLQKSKLKFNSTIFIEQNVIIYYFR